VSPINHAPSGGPEWRVQQWNAALKLLQQALEILDESEGPPHVGAMVDLAINRLQEAINLALSEQT
jgi:hypothetical protein